MDAIVSFCAGSQLLDVQDAQQLLSQTQQPGGSQAARGRSSLPLDGAACSQAAACLSQPKVWICVMLCLCRSRWEGSNWMRMH